MVSRLVPEQQRAGAGIDFIAAARGKTRDASICRSATSKIEIDDQCLALLHAQHSESNGIAVNAQSCLVKLSGGWRRLVGSPRLAVSATAKPKATRIVCFQNPRPSPVPSLDTERARAVGLALYVASMARRVNSRESPRPLSPLRIKPRRNSFARSTFRLILSIFAV